MSTLRKCTADGCPSEKVLASCLASCYSCGSKSHLPCYDIIQKANQVFISPNIVFICDECITDKSPISNTPLRPVDNAKKGTTKKDKDDQTAKALHELTSQIAKNTDQLLVLKQCVTQMDTTVQETAKKHHESYANFITTSQNGLNVPSTQPVVHGKQNVTMETVSTDTQKRNLDRALDAAKKLAVKNRHLMSGSADSSDHGLGNAEQLHARKSHSSKLNRPELVSLPKSIYVLQLETCIRKENIVIHIKNRIPSVENHFSVCCLVKQGQNLSELTFISFRVACTEQLYETMTMSFWPSHVMIGDFIEDRKPKKKPFGDFVSSKIDELTNKSGSATDEVEMDFGELSNGSKIEAFVDLSSSRET